MKIIVQIQHDGRTARKIRTADGILTADDVMAAYMDAAQELNLPFKGAFTPAERVYKEAPLEDED